MTNRWAPVVAVYAVLTLVMSWPYIDFAHLASASYGGDQRLIIWTLAWDNHAVFSGVPLFNANVFFPAAESLRYNEHLFGVSLFTLPLAAAGASPVLAHNLVWLLAWLLNGLATFALLDRYVQCRVAAIVGSLAFVYSFYVMLHAHAHLHLIWLWPLPLSMLLLERWFDAPSWRGLALWTAVLTLGALASWYVAVMMLVVNALEGLVLLTVPNAERSAPGATRLGPRRILQMSVAALVVAALVFPFARHYVGMRGGVGETLASSATLASYLVPPENTIVGRWWLENVDRRPGSIWGEQTLFAGWISLVLAFAGLWAARTGRSARVLVFPALVVVGLLLSLGPEGLPGGARLSPFAWLSGLPGFEGMRAPARFAAVAMLGVAGLVACAASALAKAVAPRPSAWVTLLVPLMLAEWFVVGFPAGKPAPLPVPPIYDTPEVRSARALVSLPEYWGQTDWVLGGDYLYFSTSHWRPILNGFGRTGPAGYDDLVRQVRDFPRSGPRLRALGVQYVVIHGDRFPNGGSDIVGSATKAGYRLVRHSGNDYLFEVS